MPWQRPWVGELSAPRNLQSGKRYRGINALLLAWSDYSDPRWTTAKAAFKMNARFKGNKGDDVRKSTLVTLWKRIKVKDADAPDGEKVILLLRYFLVFNVDQFNWPEGAIPPLTDDRPDDWNPIAAGENALQNYIDSDDELSLGYGGDRAGYASALHHIQLPIRESFKTSEGFYKTAFHEAGHSTGKELGRDLSGNRMSANYGREELVAEMTAAFVCATVGIEPDYTNSASYIKGWQQAIHDDPKMMVKAAGQAQKAADRILGVTFETN